MFLEASPERVFGLIRKVEEFSRYSDAVESIVPLGSDRYRWQVRAAGKVFSWDVAIVECVPPTTIVWRSLSGIPNTGRYHITPAGAGTQVHLVISYQLPSRLLDKTLGRLVNPVVRSIGEQALERIRQRIRAENRQAAAAGLDPNDTIPSA